MPNLSKRDTGFLGSAASFLRGSGLQKKQQEQMEEYLYRDSFTGLYNELMLAKVFSSLEKKAGHALVLLRLNGFNRVNTLFGLELSGKTIQRLVIPLQEFAQKQGGRAYRLMLDCFALMAPYSDRETFLSQLEGLLGEMEQVKVQDKHTVYSYHYTFAYGVYFLTEAEDSLDNIREIAGLTYSAIQRLRSKNETQGTIFTEQTRPDWELISILNKDLAGAWDRREFVPYYQTVYSLHNNKAVGAELLVRWIHPKHGVISPGDFLPVMESAGLIMDLDLYMVEEACKKIQGWIQAELVTVPLSINISKLNIHRQDFVKRITDIVKKYDVPPVLIELEMTESVVLYEKNEAFIGIMNALHDFGFTLTMDNFAADDFSSINMLRDLPVEIIKVDGRFFDHVESSQRERIFVTNVLRMVNEMGIKVVVGSVEHAEQAALYKQLGCNYAQGYYFSKPISNEEFENLIF